jgi:predicted RNase H-like HicB family nuclease
MSPEPEFSWENVHQAIEIHIKGLRGDGLPAPESTSFAEYGAIQ